VFSVSGAGFPRSDYANEDFFYASPSCTGPGYYSCDYANCSGSEPFVYSIGLLEPDGTAYYNNPTLPTQHLQYYYKWSGSSSVADGLAAQCTTGSSAGGPQSQPPGTLLRDVYACGPEGTYFCFDCCTPFANYKINPLIGAPSDGIPAATLDVNSFNLRPPFKLR
jgi:hypothetical protein